MGVFGINLGLVDLKRDGNPPKKQETCISEYAYIQNGR